MRIFYLAVGTVLLAVYLVGALRGGKYYAMVENLDPGEYPLRSLYGVGFVLSAKGPLALKGKAREKLVGQAKLLYDPKYAEYYAHVAWAQALAFIILGLTFGFIMAGLMDSALMLLIGLAIAGLFGWFFLNRMNDKLSDRETACTAELPEIVSSMALLINAGMTLRAAWRTVAESRDGTAYALMRDACADMENGVADIDAIHKFGRLTNSQEVRKFTGALTQSLERGGGELKDLLARQSLEMWTLKRQLMLQKGEAAASKLLMPTALLFVAIIIAVLTGAIGMLI